MTARWQTHLNRVRELDGMLQFAWTHRAMFGGAMLYADGQPIASLSDVGIGIKLAGADHAALLAVEGAKRLRYGPDQPESKTYVLVPADLTDDDDELAHWLNLAAHSVHKPRRPDPLGNRRSAAALIPPDPVP